MKMNSEHEHRAALCRQTLVLEDRCLGWGSIGSISLTPIATFLIKAGTETPGGLGERLRGRFGGGGGGGWGGGRGGGGGASSLCLSLHCHRQNDFCAKTDKKI